MGEHGLVKSRNQRGTLSACGDIAAAEVGHHSDAGEFSQQGRVVQLQGVVRPRLIQRGTLAAGAGAMAHGLTVGADGRHL